MYRLLKLNVSLDVCFHIWETTVKMAENIPPPPKKTTNKQIKKQKNKNTTTTTTANKQYTNTNKKTTIKYFLVPYTLTFNGNTSIKPCPLPTVTYYIPSRTKARHRTHPGDNE